MKKSGFWAADWFFGLVIAIAILILSLVTGFFGGLETKAYDWGVQLTSKQPSDKVAVIAIDDQSIANIGRWPWPRDVHAAMIDKLAGAKAKVIGNTVFFFEPQQDPGLLYVTKMLEIYNKSNAPAAEPVPAPVVAPPAKPGAPTVAVPMQATTASAELAQIGAVLNEAEQALNTDRRLADSIQKAGNVVLPSLFDTTFDPPVGKPDQALPEYITRSAIGGFSSAGGEFVYAAPNPNLPIEQLGSVAAGIGHLSPNLDRDGGVRQDITVVDYFGKQYPSLAMVMAAKSLNLAPKDIRVNLGESVSLGNLRILTDEHALMRPYYYKNVGERPAIPIDSFFDVLSGKIPAEKYKDKIVLIGATAAGVGAIQVTPIGALTPVEALAHSVSSILKEQFFRTPGWTLWVSLLMFVLVTVYLVVVLPKLRAGPAAMFTLLIFVALLGTHFALMMGPGIWVKLMLPAALLVIGHLLLTTKRFLMTERGKEQSEAAGAESNRMLGLAFQQQGQLDMAFDKFRK
ncbi:MAG: CHASE2 domain-containing protein, partial [Betaproteobacteria bacterium]